MLAGALELGNPSDTPNSTAVTFTLPRLGDYQLLEEIARGGMGVVYKARQISLDRIVAVKLILIGQFADKAAVRRFKGEASAAAKLRHPNIVAIYEISEEGGQHFFSMEYIEGPNLSEFIKQQSISVRQAAALVQAIAEAVHYAHEQGIIHRDLKPSNILIDCFHAPHITDFGLARDLSVDSDLTVTGQVLGSPNYISPEQASGTSIGPTSDVYSLGALLYHLLIGRPPFAAETITETLQQVATTDAISPRFLNPSVPRDLETICLKCLEKDPERRYPTAASLAEELTRFLDDQPVCARPISPPAKLWRWCRRHPAVAALSAAVGSLLLLLAIGSTAAAFRINSSREAERQQNYYSSIAAADSHIGKGEIDIALNILTNCPPEYRQWEWGRLMFLCHQDVATLRLTPAPVDFPVINPDATRVIGLTAISASRALCWDVQSGRELFASGSVSNAAFLAAFTQDGAKAAVGVLDGTVTVWNTLTGEALFSHPLERDLLSVTFSADGARLAITSSAGHGLICETTNGAIVMHTKIPQSQFTAAVLDPSGRFFVTQHRDGTIRVWNPETQSLRSSFKGHMLRDALPALVMATLVLSPDGNLLAATSSPATTKVWDLEAGQELCVIPAVMRAGSFSPDGKHLATTAYDKTLHLWDVESGSERMTLRADGPELRYVTFSADGQRVIGAMQGGVARVWSAIPGRQQIRTGSFVEALSVSADGRKIASANWNREVILWDAQSGTELTNLRGHSQWVRAVAFDPTGKLVASGAADKTVRLWDGETGRQVLALNGHSRRVETVAFSSDGRFLASGSQDGTAKIWDVAAGREIRTLRRHQGGINSLSFSPDATALALASDDGAVSIWNVRSGQLLRILSGHSKPVLALAFSPDGTLLATGGLDYKICLWDWHSGFMHAEAHRPAGVRALCFTPDGQRLVVGRSHSVGALANPAIEIWDRQLRRELLTLHGHSDVLRSIAVSLDGLFLVSGSRDATAAIWEAFPWQPQHYNVFSGSTLLARIRAYADTYWQTRLTAQSIIGKVRPNKESPVPVQDRALWPARSPSAARQQIDLSNHYNGLLTVQWEPVRDDHQLDSDLAAVPQGLVNFSDVRFDIRGLIQLRSLGKDIAEIRDLLIFPERVPGIQVNQRFRKLHLLHGTTHAERDGTPIYRSILNYADGGEHPIDVLYGRDVRDWWEFEEDPSREAERGQVVWRGTHPAAAARGRTIRLYMSTFENPLPDMVVGTLDLVSLMTQCGPFIIAISVE